MDRNDPKVRENDPEPGKLSETGKNSLDQEQRGSGQVQKRIETIIKYLAVLVPAAAGLIGVLIQWGEYAERQERLAQFRVGPEVIRLADELNNPGKKNKRIAAAYQLSWFGRPAVFLLFKRLVIEEYPSVDKAIIMAIAQIARSDEGESSVSVFLVESTNDFLNLDHDEKSFEDLKDHLMALSDTLMALRASGDASLKDKELGEGLKAAQARIKSIEWLSDERKTELLEFVDTLVQNLG